MVSASAARGVVVVAEQPGPLGAQADDLEQSALVSSRIPAVAAGALGLVEATAQVSRSVSEARCGWPVGSTSVMSHLPSCPCSWAASAAAEISPAVRPSSCATSSTRSARSLVSASSVHRTAALSVASCALSSLRQALLVLVEPGSRDGDLGVVALDQVALTRRRAPPSDRHRRGPP